MTARLRSDGLQRAFDTCSGSDARSDWHRTYAERLAENPADLCIAEVIYAVGRV